VGLSVIAFAYFIEQSLRLTCCDAQHYLEVAAAYSASGIDGVPEGLRTFAYPWILSTIQRVSSFVNLPFKLSVFFAQLVIYFCAVLSISNYLRQTSARLRSGVYLLLCFNIFLIPYIGLSLTDAIYTSITLWVLLLAIRISLPATGDGAAPRSASRLVFGCAFLVSLAIVIRPAAIWLVGPLLYCLFTLTVRWGPRHIPKLMALVLAAATPLCIQIFLNVIHFREVSFLPIVDLGQSQIVWGIENIKYGTWLGGGSPQNYYSSAALIDLSGDYSSAAWYFSNPMDACRLAIFKLVGAFDFDFLVPYPVELPTFRWAPTLLSASIAWFGLCGVVYHLLTARVRCLGSRFLPAVFLASWAAVTLPSAIELRFSLPMMSFFSLTAAAFIHFSWKENRRALAIALCGWMVMIPLYVMAAGFVRNQSILSATLQ
jgi:hypothetical protein